MNVREMIAESNRIEGILRPPTDAEVAEFERFVSLKQLTVEEVVHFVGVYQPNAVLRDREGLDVRVGDYIAPRGGPSVRAALAALLGEVNTNNRTPWEMHVRYEQLHPFTDGNGRSGRAVWYWMMWKARMVQLGFLHAFYYQTLAARS